MNAGANGQEYGKVVQSIEAVTSEGTLIEVAGGDVDWQYRGGLAGAVVTAATLRLESVESEELQEDIRDCLVVRKERTPFDLPCCGSVFKNPPGQHAAQLIETAGLKGYRLGTARVSEKHANFIISDADTLAADVEALIDYIRERVTQQFDVQLESEVRIVGEAL